MISRILFVALLFASSVVAEELQQTTLFKSGEGGYHTYRIPAAIVTMKGTLLAFCEGRSGRGDSGRIHLIVKRSADGGETFGDHTIVWKDGEDTCGNPCPVVDRTTGAIWLLMTHNLGIDREREITADTSKGKRTVWVTSSTDDGVSWATPREITADVKNPDWTWYATGPGVGIYLVHGEHNGRMVIPCDHVIKPGGLGNGNSHVIYSDDHGATWKLGGEAPKREFNESQIVELSDGRLMLNMRNYGPVVKAGAPKHRGVCTSDDGGITFKDLRRDSALIEPICQGSIIHHGRRIIFSNPASEEKRVAMTVRISDDDGQTWPKSKLIHPGPAAYSTLVSLPDGTIGLLYECGDKGPYERIDFARIRTD